MIDHNTLKESITLYLLDEADPDLKLEVEEHLSVCKECAAELEKQKELLLSFHSNSNEPDDNLLREARLQLRGALRAQKFHTPAWKSWLNSTNSFFSVNYRLALGAVTTIIAGIGLGYLLFSFKPTIIPKDDIVQTTDVIQLAKEGYKIDNVTLEEQNPQNNEVEFSFNISRTLRVKGGLNDDKIRNIFLFTILNENNPGIRFNSINLLGNQLTSEDPEVKTALITVAKYDENTGVKLEAIKTLKQFNYDEEIKNAYLYILMNDTSTGMRIEAINALHEAKQQGKTFSERDLSVFRERMRKDENNYIRYYAKSVLEGSE